MKPLTLATILSLVLIPSAHAQVKKTPVSVERAVNYVSGPVGPQGGMSFAELQSYYRLSGLLVYAGYEPREADKPAWKKLLQDEKADTCARICAAYFLVDDDEDARKFLDAQLKSQDLRYRYNAAQALKMHVDAHDGNRWAIDKLIDLVASRSLERPADAPTSFITRRDDKPGANDAFHTPLSDVCRSLGWLKEKKAVDGLISVLERHPKITGATDALGEIGDPKAIPILMKILKDKTGYMDGEVAALGKLKCKEAVPILTSRLSNPRTTFSGMDTIETGVLLDALQEIGDKSAIPAIEKYLQGDYPKESKASARRVLVQLKEADPVPALLKLLKAETDEWEKSNLLFALAKHRDARVVAELAGIANQSASARMRRSAIRALALMGSRKALLELAALLEAKFPEKLPGEWKVAPDPEYFPKLVQEYLKEATKQDLGKNRGPWAAWIEQNVKEVERAKPD